MALHREEAGSIAGLQNGIYGGESGTSVFGCQNNATS